MEVIDFSKTNSVINQYMSELRDKNTQKNRLLFRHNIKRIGIMMAYELSKTLEYKPKTVTTPLGTIDIPLPKEDMVIATVLRAGLPFHEGFLDVFDKADNGFVSAFRMYINREHTEVGVHTEYIATQSVKNKTLLIVDPMLATGGSLAAAIESLLQAGKPKKIHLCCVIAAPEGIEVVKEALPEGSTIWCAAVNFLGLKKFLNLPASLIFPKEPFLNKEPLILLSFNCSLPSKIILRTLIFDFLSMVTSRITSFLLVTSSRCTISISAFL